eukprot:4644356-Alexandrium_andersonii.AAC.1
MLSVLIPGVPIADAVCQYFSRFSTRPTKHDFRDMIEEQIARVDEVAGSENNPEMFLQAASVLAKLFGAARD